MKYMVMECHPAYAVVLAEDGRFLKVANMHFEVGQSVTEVVQLQLPETAAPVKNSRRWIRTLGAMAACLALTFGSLFYANQMPYASVYLTINPEVRIDVNRKDAVVDVEGVNPDGETLVEGYEHKGKELDLVMDELVDRAIDMGYLHEGGTVKLSLEADEAWIGSHSDHLNEHLNDHLAESITVTINVEQKQAPEEIPEPEIPAKPIVIPVEPKVYAESDYGEEREDNDRDDEDDRDDEEADSRDEDGETDYKASEKKPAERKKKSSKKDAEDVTATPQDDDEPEEKQTDYDRSDEDNSTDYEEAEEAEKQTDYQTSKSSQKAAAESDDGESDYKASEKEDDREEDGKSAYEEEDEPEEDEDDEEDDEESDSEYEKEKK